MKDISVLIPTYNDVCVTLVRSLHHQAAQLGIRYEIVVADDGSTCQDSILQNRTVNSLPHCRYMERTENVGRAAIRNFLARQAQYEWLLFVDGDMVVRRSDYLQRYATSAADDAIVCGGVSIGPLQPGNLRSMYEHQAAPEHTLERRRRSPYHDFHTANFLVRRELMLSHPFDLRFRHYGYEDVLFGKQMEQLSVPVTHTDNPLSFERFEANADFVSKTEEGIRTLCQFRHELHGYARLLDIPAALYGPLRLWHRLFGRLERSCLTGSRPRLWLFRLYKLGYFASHI